MCLRLALGSGGARCPAAAAAVGALAARRGAVGLRAAHAGECTRQPLAAVRAFPHAEYRNAPLQKLKRHPRGLDDLFRGVLPGTLQLAMRGWSGGGAACRL
jgi:hypothetical protein